jgi:hypothetical protein
MKGKKKKNNKNVIYLAVSSSTISICNGDRQVAERERKRTNIQ